jgi:threonine/homoserine/homoserine lactone efflux protein
MSAAELGALLAFATAMAFTPGPNTTLSAAIAANRGLGAALPFVLAVPVGWGLMLLASVAGLGALLTGAPLLRGGVKTLGLAYLVWLAWRLWGSAQLADREGGLDVGFMQGVALQFVNIKAWMTGLVISASWITVGTGSAEVLQRTAQVLPLMMVYGLLSNFTYALVGSALRGWLAQGRRLQRFNRALALVLLVTAVWMARL